MIKHILKWLFYYRKNRISWVKTLVFNFRYLPFAAACKLPVLIYKGVYFSALSGQVVFTCPLQKGLVKIGLNTDEFSLVNHSSSISIMGKVIFHGPSNFSINTVINVAANAVLEIGSACSFGNGVKIRCWRRISFGQSSWIALDTQVFDTNFHYLLDLEDGKVENHRKEVEIGDYVWIGNRCTIGPYAKIPNHSVVASNSLVNKDFTGHPHKSILLAGIPSKIVSENKVLIFDPFLQEKIDLYYQVKMDTFYQKDFCQYREDISKLENWTLNER